jgi:hypothetical protein
MEVLLMKEERIQGAACLAAVAILDEVKAPEGWRKVPMWVDIAESYVEANTWEERKRFGKALDAALARVSASPKERSRLGFGVSPSFSAPSGA